MRLNFMSFFFLSKVFVSRRRRRALYVTTSNLGIMND
jgi:hypothetical protein